MSDEATSLPTDSLYKMLTIGGIVLVVGGLALCWKSVDETQSSQIVLAEAEKAMTTAMVPIQLDYLTLCKRHKEVEDEMKLILSGTNVVALREFKGGQPSEFPSLAEALHSAIQNPNPISIEWGVTPPPSSTQMSTISQWIAIAEVIRNHKTYVASFLSAPNLTVIDKATATKALKSIADLQSLVDALEQKAIALSTPEQALNSAKLKCQLAEKRRSLILGAGLLLFSVGVFVFGRASKNWYDQVQRFEDAKLQREVGTHGITDAVSYWRELTWLLVPAAVAVVLLLLFICLRF